MSEERLVLGLQPVRELIRARGKAVSSVLVQNGDSPRLAALARFVQDQGIPLRRVSRDELDRVARGQMHQGTAAYGPELPFTLWSTLRARPDLLAIALDGVVDPHNFGAVIRSAVGLANAPIIWPESGAAPLTPATFRASAGAVEHASLCRVHSLHGTLGDAALAGIQVVGLEPQATLGLHELDLRGPTIIVIGSEEKGMARAVRRSCTHLVRLVNSGAVQSLNASVAAGIALHTALISRLKTNS